ncbi:response regulator [Poseidonocella sp. HB161398]|uniref:response regulator n=1 Tax=Poseidonocella sp. HB161398 TaxID=2320855 RepID=UPI001109B687|nr:response regulator [Poseidonocella sp. HB161398]
MTATSGPSALPPGWAVWPRGLAGLAGLVALLNLSAGWGFGTDVFLRIRPGYPAMVPGTAACLLLAAGAVAAGVGAALRPLRIAFALAIPALVAASLTVPALDLEPDGMSVATEMICLFAALCLLLPRGRAGTDLARLAAETAGLGIVAIPLLGYLFNAEALFSNPVYTKMALHTAAGFGLLFLALLAEDARLGWMAVVTGPGPGSQMLRRLLPVLVLGPVALTGMALVASRRDALAPDLRAAMLTFAMIVLGKSAAIFFAHLANRSDLRAAHAEIMWRDSERARLAAELAMERGQRIEALGRLVGGVAHDFNNTLAVILGNLQLLQSDRDSSAHQIYVDEALRATDQATQLTRQLLAYGRKSYLDPAPVALDALVEDSLRMFRRLCPANVAVTARLAAPSAVVDIDAANFRQALLNVLINARDAQPGGGAITVSTRIDELGPEAVAGFGRDESLAPGWHATVLVSDDGPGMEPRLLARAAEPFFTTKPLGEGTGLGLSAASGFCRQSGGGLRLSCPPGEGLTVSMAFPLAGGASVPETPGAVPRPAAQSRRILLVDDDPNVAQVMARQLRMDGHSVDLCQDADAALSLLAAGPLPDLVISDVVMPGRMQGHALARTIGARHPGLPVLLMSGCSLPGPRDGTEDAAMPALQKPVAWSVLREAVAAVPLREAPRPARSGQRLDSA